MNVEEWFNTHTFKSKSFRSLKRLLKLKKAKKQTISLVIPTLNEEDSIGATITTIKSGLMDKHGLIDEIVVVDSGSTDKTEEIARKSGARFYRSAEILKRYGPARGKGENLWKSLYVTHGSIIVFIDADIKNIHPRFVYGLVGPLLTHDSLAYTKAFYRYYRTSGDAVKIRGWGRVTELFMRPLINMFFPRLSGIIQPSSGQFAGKRELFEKLSFFTGYGVEMGLLIDIQKKFGLRKIAQVGLGRLSHRHKDSGDKGPMAFAILQVLCRRANSLGKLILVDKIRKKYRMVEGVKEGNSINYRLKNIFLEEKQRPPMITVREYRKKFLKK